MAIKNTQRFAEVEYCLQRYFDGSVATIMKSVRDDLSKKQTHELAEYQTSARGILSSFAAGMSNNLFYNPVDTLKATGEWNSKTAEDYVEMCKTKILKNQNIQNDLVRLADEWRTTVVKEIGRERYDELSKNLGRDLAFAYVDYRTEQMMIDYMAKENMPQSSIEYVLRKGANGSLLGLGNVLMKSPLQSEIDRRSEAAYKPSTKEKVAGHAVSIGADIASTGGVSSWGGLIGWGITDVICTGIDQKLENKANKQVTSVEQCISKGVFGSSNNVFEGFRSKGKNIVSYENDYVLSVNKNLSNKMRILTEKPNFPSFTDAPNLYPDLPSPTAMMTTQTTSETKPRNPNVPLVVLPDHEDEYLEMNKKKAEETEKTEPVESEQTENQQQVEEPQVTNESGWSNLLTSLGLNDMGKIGSNLGYVIAMLPDMLLGMFTGKTQSVNVKKDMIPMASILLGMFVKNPLLKMTLIGMGGANLLNKFGHEAIDRQEQKLYKKYADEQLNPRISNPTLNGNTLIAMIDRVPCSITLPDSAVAAYKSGALPLNTLANAVLAKSDNMHQLAQANYRDVNLNQNNERQLTLK